mmetsp:Transcript_68090/g.134348  ORF Transcript_68090/g.134348 Transcript_68090/m.134348 type:complete len:881 (-) Transcript_68090:111-2753(-)
MNYAPPHRKGPVGSKIRTNAKSAPGVARTPLWHALEEDYHWEVLERGDWEPFNKDIDLKLKGTFKRSESEVVYSVGKKNFRVSLTDPIQGEQVDLTTSYISPVRRSNFEQVFLTLPARWSKVISHPSLEYDSTFALVRTADAEDLEVDYAGKVVRLAYGSKLMYLGTHRITFLYRGGDLNLVAAGIAQIDEPKIRDKENRLLSSWAAKGENLYHPGCFLYSFGKNQVSHNGGPWQDFRPPAEPMEWELDDELLVDFCWPDSTLAFYVKKHGDETEYRLGVIAVDTQNAKFRACAVLGGHSQRFRIFQRVLTTQYRSGADEGHSDDSTEVPITALPNYLFEIKLKRPRRDRRVKAHLKDTANRGIRLGQLQTLGDTMKGTLEKHAITDSRSGKVLDWASLTMYSVNTFFVMPLTKQFTSSFVELVATNIQDPLWMVSHAWSTAYANTLRMLWLHSGSRYADTPVDTVYWCCTMANNQHDLSELAMTDVLRSPFARVLVSEHSLGTILLCDEAVTPLSRVWCVFELHLTMALRHGDFPGQTKSLHFLDVACSLPRVDDAIDPAAAMLQDALDGNFVELSDPPGVFFPLEVARCGTQVDIATAKASQERDKRTILNYVTKHKVDAEGIPPESHVCYDKLNDFVHNIFASAELYRLASERPPNYQKDLKRLLESRANPNVSVRGGNTALLAALGAPDATTKDSKPAEGDELTELIATLLAGGADPNSVNSDCATAVDVASSLSEEAALLLTKHGGQRFSTFAPVCQIRLNYVLEELCKRAFGDGLGENDVFQGSGGGGCGSILKRKSELALTQAAALLKRYPKAKVVVGIVNSRMDKFHLRGSRVALELKRAGCKNQCQVVEMESGPWVTLSLVFKETMRSITS